MTAYFSSESSLRIPLNISKQQQKRLDASINQFQVFTLKDWTKIDTSFQAMSKIQIKGWSQLSRFNRLEALACIVMLTGLKFDIIFSKYFIHQMVYLLFITYQLLAYVSMRNENSWWIQCLGRELEKQSIGQSTEEELN